MTVMYVAFDGKQFDDEWDCRDYEWRCAHEKFLDKIEFYDADGIRVFDYFSGNAYNSVVEVVVKDKDLIPELLELVDYTGFCNYADITSEGVWVWDDWNEAFIKKEN